MNMRPINRIMPWIACGSAAVLTLVVFFEAAEPPDQGTGVGPEAPAKTQDVEALPVLVEVAAPAAPVALTPAPTPDRVVTAAPSVPAQPARRTKAARRAFKPEPSPVDTTAPALVIITPSGPEFSLRSELLVRVRSEPGARVQVSGRTLAERTPGVFSGTLRLSPGANELQVSAEDGAGNRSARVVRVTFVDLDRIPHDRLRLERMLGQLDDIRTAASELDRRILGLLKQMKAVADAAQVARLSDELRQIRSARREVGQELSNALGQLDSLLAVAN